MVNPNTAAFTNLSYLSTFALWLLTLFVWIYTPGLLSVVRSSLSGRTREGGMSYIARFVPLHIFRFLVYLLGSLGIAVLSTRLLGLSGQLTLSSYSQQLQTLGLISAGSYAFLYLRSKLFRLWRYLYLDSTSGDLLTQDYFFQDWLRSLLMAPLALLWLSPLRWELLLGISLGLLSLIQALGILQLIRRLGASDGSYMLLFLYLCAHELAPFLYLIGLGRYLGMYS